MSKQYENYAKLIWRKIHSHYTTLLARGNTGEPAVVPSLSQHGLEILYYITGWEISSLIRSKNIDPIITGILRHNLIKGEQAIELNLPMGCITRRCITGTGTFISKCLFDFYLELERICRGFALPSVLRRLRASYLPDVTAYAHEKATTLSTVAATLVKSYREAYPLTNNTNTRTPNLVEDDVKKYTLLLLKVLVHKYMPLRTEEALRWLMEDIGLRKSDAGAIRASLKSKAGEVKLEPGNGTTSTTSTNNV